MEAGNNEQIGSGDTPRPPPPHHTPLGVASTWCSGALWGTVSLLY